MAVTKLKSYHSDTAVKNAVGYVLNADKTRLQDTSRFVDAKGMEIIENAMHYAENRLKTTYVAEDGKTEVLVSGHRCKIDLAKDTPDVLDPLKFLRQREVVHFQRFGEALRGVQDKLAEKKFYMANCTKKMCEDNNCNY